MKYFHQSFSSFLYKLKYVHGVQDLKKVQGFVNFELTYVTLHVGITGPDSAFGNLSDCRSTGPKFDSNPVPYFPRD